MGRTRKLSPFLNDFAATVATSILITISLLMITRVIATKCGPEELGVYVLFRRVGAFLVPVSTFMIGVGLTRAIAMAKAQDKSLAISAAILGLVGSTATGLLLMLVPHFQSHMTSEGRKIAEIARPLLAFIYANLIFTITYSWYRGTGEMRKANIWQLLCVALIPLAAIVMLAGRWPIGNLLNVIALAYALPIIFVVNLVRPRTGLSTNQLRMQIAELARYCLPRIPGSLGLTAILALAPLAAAFRLGLTQSGYLGAGQSIFAVSEGGATALSLLLLPKLSSLLSEGRTAEIRERVSEMTLFLVQIGLPLALIVPLFAREIIAVWLGHMYSPAATVMQIYSVGLFPYVTYVALRSVLDATEVRALNTVSILTALGLQTIALLAALQSDLTVEYYAAATTLAMTALGAQSFYFVWRRGTLCLKRREILIAIGGTILVAGPVLAIELVAQHQRISRDASALKLATSLATGAVYLTLLYRSRSRWIVALTKRISPGA